MKASRRSWCWLLLLPGALFVVVSASRAAQERVADRQPDVRFVPADPALGQYDGARACQQCHSAPLAVKDSDAYVALTEFKKWSEEDKHARAFEVLQSERSIGMGKSLGYEPTKAWQCLNCHSLHVAPELRPNVELKEGVSCGVCHGPSEKWFRPHFQPAWRTKPMAEKESLGFVDVRSPLKRAKLCASCHIGDLEAGRFVTHEMFAAGHPPLPGFELGTFCAEMPRHWRRHAERAPAVQEELKNAGLVDPEVMIEAKAVLVGAAVGLRESLRLTQGQADGKRPWPELALYDCFACHHDLRSSSWRQRPERLVGAPGRPMPKRWPETLVAAGLELLGEKPAVLQDQLQPLRLAFAARPFGAREEVEKHSADSLTRIEEQIGRLDALRVRRAESLRLLHILARKGEQELLDYDSARQVAWAFKVVYEERHSNEERQREPQVHIGKVLDELDKMLKLRLHVPGQRVLQPDLAGRLQHVYAYEPEEVRKLFGRLRAAVPEK